MTKDEFSPNDLLEANGAEDIVLESHLPGSILVVPDIG